MDTKEAGALGGAARSETLSARRRKAIAKAANKVRWDNYYGSHPEKVRPKRKRGKAA